MLLRACEKELIEEWSRVWEQKSYRVWHECQAYRQAAMRKYGITDQSSTDGTQVREPFGLERQQQLPVNISQRAASTHRTDSSYIPRLELTLSQLKRTKITQIQHEQF